MRRAILILTAVLILLMGCTALWEASGCMFVGGKLCTVRTRELDLSGKPLTDVDRLRRLDQLEKLNLRNTGLTVEDYEELRAALPNCRIAWSVPFQGSTYPEDTTHLSVSSVLPEELHILAYFPALESLDATRCTDLNTIKILMAARPDCKVDYVVPLNGQLHTPDTQSLVLGTDSVQALKLALTMLPQVREVDATACGDHTALHLLEEEFPHIAFRYRVIIGEAMADATTTELTVKNPNLPELEKALRCLPGLKILNLTGKLPENDAIRALNEKFPAVEFRWSFKLFGKTVKTTDTQLDVSGIVMRDTAQLEAALQWLPNLERVDMDGCGISSEQMGQLQERHPEIKFIWTVSVGSKIRIRTDATSLMPFQYGVTLTDADTKELKYCTEMICLDLGHSMISDISFLAHMPDIQYLTLGETPVQDISPLEGLKKLVFLELFLTKVTDYSPLLGCAALEDLNISYAIPGDISVLTQMTQLEHLHMKGLWQEDWQRQLRQALPNTAMVFAGTEDVSSTGEGWRKLENYYKMRDILGMPYMSY